MSAANAALIRRWLETINDYWQRGESLEEKRAEVFEADVDYYPVRKWPEAEPCHGLEELGRFMDDYRDAWIGGTFEPLEVSGVGDDRVLAHVRLGGEGPGSGLRMGGDIYVCFWLRHGRIFRQEDHLTENGARHALGLPPPGEA